MVAALVLAACGSSGSSSPSTAPSGPGDSTTTTAAANGGGSSTDASIPESAAIDSITKHLTDPKAADLVAKCNALGATVLGKTAGLDNDPDVQASLAGLVDVVRPLDTAVADALAKDAKSAAAWCKATGMTNF